MNPTGARAGGGLVQVGGVTVDGQEHGAGGETSDGVGMGGCVVEQVGGRASSGMGAFGLGGRKGAEGDQHGGINVPGVVK